MSQSYMMIVNSAAAALFPTDHTIPFRATASGWAFATRTLTDNVNTTPFNVLSLVGGATVWVEWIENSLVTKAGEFEIESTNGTTTLVLKDDPRLKLLDRNIAVVRGWVQPNADSAVIGGATVLAAEKQSSFIKNAGWTVVDGLVVITSDSQARTIDIRKFDGTTLVDAVPIGASMLPGSSIALGRKVPGGISAICSSANATAKLYFHIAEDRE